MPAFGNTDIGGTDEKLLTTLWSEIFSARTTTRMTPAAIFKRRLQKVSKNQKWRCEMRLKLVLVQMLLLISVETALSRGDFQEHKDRPLRVLLDWSISMEYGTRGGLLNRYLDEQGKTVSYWSFNWPSQSGLANFDVLIIDNLSIFSYPQSEIQAIETFVHNGGGLLIAGHGQRYKQRARELKGPLNYPLNKLSSRFGIIFNSKQAKPPYHFNQNSFVGVSFEWQTDPHLGSGNRVPATLTIDKNSEPVLLDSNGVPIIAIRNFGEGYIAAISDTWFFSHPDNRVSPKPANKEFIKNIVNWLGTNRCGRGTVPDDREIRGPMIIDDGRFRVYAVEPLVSYARKFYQTAVRTYNEVSKIFGYETSKNYNLFATPERPSGGGASGREDGYLVGVGVICLEPKDEGRMAGLLGHEIAHTFIRGRLGQLEESFASLVAYRSLIAMNMDKYSTNRDAENPKRLEDWPRLKFEEVDPEGNLIDLAKPVPMHLDAGIFGKGMWVIESLEKQHGSDFMRRYFQLLQSEKIEHTLNFSEVVGYMSRIADKDLTPWFQSIGTSISQETVVRIWKVESENSKQEQIGEILPEHLKKMKEGWSGSIVGIGISLKKVENGILIQDVLSKPAQKAGLKAEQIII